MPIPTYTTPYEIQFTAGDRVVNVEWETPDKARVVGLPGTVVCAPRYSRTIIVHWDGDMHFTKVQTPRVRHVGLWQGFDGCIYNTGERDVTIMAGPIEVLSYAN